MGISDFNIGGNEVVNMVSFSVMVALRRFLSFLTRKCRVCGLFVDTGRLRLKDKMNRSRMTGTWPSLSDRKGGTPGEER